jgi:Golgi nucleoside diphosphatase
LGSEDEDEGVIDVGRIAAQQALEALPEQLAELRTILRGIFVELRLLRYLKEIEVLVSEDRRKEYEKKKQETK